MSAPGKPQFKCEERDWKAEWEKTHFIPPIGVAVTITPESCQAIARACRGLRAEAELTIKQVAKVLCQHGDVRITRLRWPDSGGGAPMKDEAAEAGKKAEMGGDEWGLQRQKGWEDQPSAGGDNITASVPFGRREEEL